MKRVPSIYNVITEFNADNTNEFDRARMQLDAPFLYLDIDLSQARTNQVLKISGDFLYVDASSAGIATIELNNQQDAPDAPLQISANFVLKAPFAQVKISNSAQAGAKLRLIYSTGYAIEPSSAQQSTVVAGGGSVGITNTNCPTAGTFTALPQVGQGVKKMTFKPRGGGYLALTSDTTKTIRLESGQSWSEVDLILSASINFSFQPDTANTVVEVITWQ